MHNYPFPTHSISRGHFQPLQALNILSFQFPWAVGLKTSSRGHFSHPKKICDPSHTHHLTNLKSRLLVNTNLV